MKLLPINPVTDTVKIRPRRVYKCDQENRVMERKSVTKDQNGKYHCSSCGGLVRDVTDTETGRNLMELVGL